jgi:hypothetical protein
LIASCFINLQRIKDNLASLSNWQLWRSQLAAAHGVNIYTANQWENITLESKRHATESAP